MSQSNHLGIDHGNLFLLLVLLPACIRFTNTEFRIESFLAFEKSTHTTEICSMTPTGLKKRRILCFEFVALGIQVYSEHKKYCNRLSTQVYGLHADAEDIFPYFHMRTAICRKPLLWTASHHSASPAVNFPSEDSISGAQLCPQALILKNVHSNYPIFWQLLKNLTRPYSACIQLFENSLWKSFPEINGIIYKYNCVKDMFLLFDLCLGNGWGRFWDCCFIHCFKYESQNHKVTLEQCTPVEL